MAENIIRMAPLFYEIRDSTKEFYREEYFSKIEQYKDIISEVMKLKKLDVVSALQYISKNDFYKGNGMLQMLLISAAVEIMEPSKQT